MSYKVKLHIELVQRVVHHDNWNKGCKKYILKLKFKLYIT